MAIYHLSAKIIGRSSGRSVVAAAAYRSATCLYCDYDGRTSDYTRKNWVIHSEILLPESAPESFRQRESLWNAVESTEKSINAQLAREIEIALPKELSLEDQLEITRKFICENFISKGLCVDFAIHNPPMRNDLNQPITIDNIPTNDLSKMVFQNPHVHILVSMRPLDMHGDFEYKSQAEYICRRGTEEKAFTSSEFKEASQQGWEKLYKYQNGKKQEWMTPSVAEVLHLTRVHRAPKKSPYGRKNPVLEFLSSKEALKDWRKSWELTVNTKFESLNMDYRIDSRSYKDQGREDEIPTIHMGTEATNIERRANRLEAEGLPIQALTRSYIGDINRDIHNHNRILAEMKKALELAYNTAKDLLLNTAQRLESIRCKLMGYHYQKVFLSRRKQYYYSLLIDAYDEAFAKSYKKLETNIDVLKEKNKQLEYDYSKTLSAIDKDDISLIEQHRIAIRHNMEDSIKEKLKEHYKDAFDEQSYIEVKKQVDQKLLLQEKSMFKHEKHHTSRKKISYDMER